MENQLLLFGAEAAQGPRDPILDAFRRLAPAASARVLYASARRRIFSWRTDPATGAVALRLGNEFRAAPPDVAEALVRIVTRRRLPRDDRRRLLFEIRRWFAAHGSCGAPAGRSLPSRGRHVDLVPILEGVRSRHFRDPAEARIGWSERPARRLMGRFESGSPAGLIVINRLLDSPLAPAWYLDFLVFHEMLHAMIPPRPGRSRILVHPPEFRREERRHPDRPRAKAFERWVSGPGFHLLLDPRGAIRGVPAQFRDLATRGARPTGPES